MYIPPPGNSQDPGAWNPMGRQSSRNRFQPAVRVIRWKELRGLQHLADGAMCSCYTAELEGHGIVVVKKPSDHSNEVFLRQYDSTRNGEIALKACAHLCINLLVLEYSPHKRPFLP